MEASAARVATLEANVAIWEAKVATLESKVAALDADVQNIEADVSYHDQLLEEFAETAAAEANAVADAAQPEGRVVGLGGFE